MDQEIKQRIHEKALDHFLQFGFSKVTMNEIAGDLGVSKKTLYQYFPGKEELLAAVVAQLHEDTAAQIQSIIGREDLDFVAKLHKSLNALAALHSKMTPYFLSDLEKHAPEVCKRSNDFKRDTIRSLMSTLVAEGIQKGVFRNDIDQELIIHIYSGALQHLLRPETFVQLGLSVEQIHRAIGTVVLEGIVRPESRPGVARAVSRSIAGSQDSVPLQQEPTANRSGTAVHRNPESLS